jgi:hypothetical protein
VKASNVTSSSITKKPFPLTLWGKIILYMTYTPVWHDIKYYIKFDVARNLSL